MINNTETPEEVPAFPTLLFKQYLVLNWMSPDDLTTSEHFYKPLAIRTMMNTFLIGFWDGQEFFTPEGNRISRLVIIRVFPLPEDKVLNTVQNKSAF